MPRRKGVTDRPRTRWTGNGWVGGVAFDGRFGEELLGEEVEMITYRHFFRFVVEVAQ